MISCLPLVAVIISEDDECPGDTKADMLEVAPTIAEHV